jgi:hypothetical protein
VTADAADPLTAAIRARGGCVWGYYHHRTLADPPDPAEPAFPLIACPAVAPVWRPGWDRNDPLMWAGQDPACCCGRDGEWRWTDSKRVGPLSPTVREVWRRVLTPPEPGWIIEPFPAVPEP